MRGFGLGNHGFGLPDIASSVDWATIVSESHLYFGTDTTVS